MDHVARKVWQATSVAMNQTHAGTPKLRRGNLSKPNHNFETWSLDEANPTVQRWQIRALLAVGYHLHSTRFCHMYNLEDSMVELKHNAQTSKHKHFSFVLESSVS